MTKGTYNELNERVYVYICPVLEKESQPVLCKCRAIKKNCINYLHKIEMHIQTGRDRERMRRVCGEYVS